MRGSRVVRCIVAVLTVWALATIAPDLVRPFEPLATIGLTTDFGGCIVAIDADGPAARAGLRPSTACAGDRVDFERTPPATLFVLFGGLGGRPYVTSDRTLDIALIAPDGAHRRVVLKAQPREPPIIERVSLFLSEILGIGFILLGAFLAWQFPQRRDVFGFFLNAIWFNPGQNYVFYQLLPRPLWFAQELLSALLQALGLAGFALFALRFPTERAEGWRRWAERALPPLVLVLTTLTVVGSGAEFGHPNRPVWLLVFWLKAAICPLIIAAFLTKLQLLPPVDRQRLRLVIFGCIPGLFFYLLGESADATTLWQPLFDQIGWSPPDVLLDAAYLANALVPISIAYAVLRQRVLPIDFIVNRAVTLGIVWVIVGMTFEAIVLTTHRFLEENHVLSTLLIAAVLVATAPLLERLKEQINELVDRLVFVRLHKAKKTLDRVVGELEGVTSLHDIDLLLVESPCAQFGLACAALFSLEDDGVYRLAAQRDWPRDAIACIPADHPIVDEAQRAARDPAAGRITQDRPGFPTGAAQPELVLPLGPKEFLEALVIFSGHAAGSSLTPDEIAVLVPFVHSCGASRAHVVALAMHNEVVALRNALAQTGSRALEAAD